MTSWLDDALRLFGRLIVLAMFALLAFFVSGIVLKPVFPDGVPAGPEGMLLFGFLGAVALLVAHVAVVLIFERGRWEVVGMGAHAWRPMPILLGAVAGILVIIIPSALLLATNQAHFETMPAGSWGSAALDAMLWLAAPALFEELIARGYVLGTIAKTWGEPAAITLTSLGFGLLHLGNPGATAWSVGAVVIAGVFLASVRLGTGSLAAAWLAHLGVNWAQGAIMHAPISGLTFLPTPNYRLVSEGPAWLTGGEWGLEAGAVTAATVLLITFLFFLSRRGASNRTMSRLG